jgi:hypothetical protein
MVFNGYIYGLSDGYIYKLDMSTYNDPVWDWNIINDMVQSVTHVSVTLNGEYMWVQTSDNKGYLFNCDMEIEEESDIDEGTYRVYGFTKNSWLVVSAVEHTATLYPSEYVVHKVYDAALSHDNQIVVSENPNNQVRIVNWRVAYPYRPGTLPDITCL